MNEFTFLGKSSTVEHRLESGVSDFMVSLRLSEHQEAKFGSTRQNPNSFTDTFSEILNHICNKCFLLCILIQKIMSLCYDTKEPARVVFVRSSGAPFLGLPYLECFIIAL